MNDNEGPKGYASPPCFLHELDPAYLGWPDPQGPTIALVKPPGPAIDGARAPSHGKAEKDV